MKVNLIYTFCLLLLATVGFAQNKTMSERMAISAMEKQFKGDQFTNKEKGPKWTYDMGVVLDGIAEVWKNTGKAEYFNYIQAWMDQFVTPEGGLRNYDPTEYNIDHIKNGTSLLLLYKVTGNQKYLKAADLLYTQLQSHPRTNEGGFWHKEIYPYQMWLDGLYMGQPFYTEYASIRNIPSIYEDVVNQFTYMEKHARDEKTGLLYHGWDESRKERWSDPQTGLSKHFWGRGMGWFSMGLVDVLEYFPKDHPRRKELLAILERTLTAAAKYQDRKTSVWYDIVDLGTRDGNYVEASASSMFVYAMAKAVRRGYVSDSFAKNVYKGYKGLLKEFVTDDGPDKVDINGVVEVSGLGGSKYRDGSFEYYMSEPVRKNDPKGVGAFIRAASEAEFLQGIKGKHTYNVTLDNYYNNEYKESAGGQLLPYHYLWDGWDNNGYGLFGRLFARQGAKLHTLKQAPTAANLAQSDVYIIVDPDTQKETDEPNYMNEPQAVSIAQWVHDGGVLVMLLNDAGNCEIEKFNTLAQKFGITFNQDSRNRVQGKAYHTGAIAIPAGNSILKDTKKIYIKEISTLQVVSPAKAELVEGGDVIIATAKYGKGTVLAVGDPWVYNEYIDGRKLPAEYENFKASTEIVSWLLKKAN
ncbi:MAG: glycoside hydrolase family 88 protein [Sphingobacteriaceae bacterium]